MEALITALATSGNLAIIALSAMVVLLYGLLRTRDEQTAQERKEMIATLHAIAEAVTELRVELASRKK